MPEARAFCNNLGQKLFEPKSLEAINQVSELAKAQGGYAWGYWIGIHDQINQGNFVYDSDNEPIVYENWSPGEPNGESREDCTALLKNGGKWLDMSCNWELPFVCESGKSTSFVLSLILVLWEQSLECTACSHFFPFLARNGLKFLVSCEKSK